MTEILFIAALALASILLVTAIGKTEEPPSQSGANQRGAEDSSSPQLASEALRESNERLLKARVSVTDELPYKMAEAWQEEQRNREP